MSQSERGNYVEDGEIPVCSFWEKGQRKNIAAKTSKIQTPPKKTPAATMEENTKTNPQICKKNVKGAKNKKQKLLFGNSHSLDAAGGASSSAAAAAPAAAPTLGNDTSQDAIPLVQKDVSMQYDDYVSLCDDFIG